ncbi:hypothetical protein LTR36_002802 [Oleoguttula mirabilis]|uniref:Uncharacterized protein n=1 Tax=Oleoguttula mirabilis TaxID=1507867 RepID=A0AAV9JKA5_9PEZI|nr:hypothetical protein LTR36_002802 [Oleoguttula mirabilis]
MAPISSFLLALASTAATVAAQGSFTIPNITSHQPNGSPEGQVDYYSMGFAVTSTLSGNKSGYCTKGWSDNDDTSQVAYSENVPTGSWVQCDSSSANYGDGDSEFAYQLFPYFSIGNWSIQVQQT